MKVTLIVRLLTADGDLLGWVAMRAKAKGDQCLWADERCAIAITQAGHCAVMSVHWPDLHVQQRCKFDRDVTLGEIVVVQWPDAVMAFPSDEGPLPAVTVGASTIALPATVIGMEAH